MAKTHIPFLKGDICSTSGVSISQSLVDQYSEEVIELAIQLKANNLNGVGGNRKDNAQKPLSSNDQSSYDTFFVESAIRMLNNEQRNKIFAIFKEMAKDCPIDDPQWAGYSADEILAMEKNGVLIPEDIVAWAHSQQQLDETNYVLETDSNTEDPTVEDTFANTDSLDVLQATAKKNIEKAENADKKVEEKKEKYETIAQKATQIKKEKENSFFESIQKIKTLQDKWEALKTKKETGKLTANEESEFKELSKQLKNSDTETKSTMQTGKNDLDDFLKELDSLNLEINNTAQIAKDTIYSGRTLNTLTKNYNVYNLPYAYTGTSFDNSGLISLTLNGMTNEEIGELAVQKGEELDTNNNTIETEASGGEYSETIEFATNYTNYITESETKTENEKNKTEGSATEPETTDQADLADDATTEDGQTNTTTDNQTTQNNGTQNETPSIKFGIKESIQATQRTIDSSSTDVDKTGTVISDNKDLNKELKTAKIEMTYINKEVDSLNEKLTGNEQDTETFLQELERLQAESSEDGIQVAQTTSQPETQTENTTTTAQQQPEVGTVVKNGQSEIEKSAQTATTVLNSFAAADQIIAQNTNKPENVNEEITPEEAAKKEKEANIKSKKLELAQNIQDLGEDRTDISTDLEKAITAGDLATTEGVKSLEVLSKSHGQLTTQNATTSQDATDAIETGTMTQAIGLMDKFNGIATFSYGVLLASNPFTMPQGMLLMGIGNALQIKGNLEVVTGTVAATSGAAGKATTLVANSAIGSAVTTMTQAESILNVNVTTIDEANAQAEEGQNPTQTQNQNNTTTPTQATTGENPVADAITGVTTAPETNTQTQDQTTNSTLSDAINNVMTQQVNPTIQQEQETTNTTTTPETNNEVAEQPAQTPANTTVNEETNTNTNTTTQEEQTTTNGATQQTAETEQKQPAQQETQENNAEGTEPQAIQNTTQTQVEKNQPQNPSQTQELQPQGVSEQKQNTEETTPQTNTNTTEESKNAESTKKETEEATEKDADNATKESKGYLQDMNSANKEDEKSQKDAKSISKEIKDINKTTKKDDEKFQKEVKQEQKQIEKIQQEIEEKNQKMMQLQEEQVELQTNLEELNAAFNSATPTKQAEIQANIQTKSGQLLEKNSQSTEVASQNVILKVGTTKKVQGLRRSIQVHTTTAKRNQKIATNDSKTADKILKIADTTSQVAGLASIAGSITSKIGNAVTLAGNTQITAGNIQISTGTPLLSNPFTVSLGTALITAGTSQVVAGSAQVATGTTTSIIGESVSLAANITNTAASATKAAIYIEQGNIAGALMATGSAIMSGVSAGQNISQIGQLNQMADSASAVASSAQQASTQATGASNAVNNGTATTTQLADTTASINDSMTGAINGTTDASGKVVSQGFNQTSSSISKAAKIGFDDVMQIGGAAQTVGSMIGTDNDGSADIKQDRKLRRFGSITRINTKKKLQKVNSVSTSSYNSRRGGNY